MSLADWIEAFLISLALSLASTLFGAVIVLSWPG
jgi:hypothetical protein